MSPRFEHPVEAIHDALDGRLSERDRAALDLHLESCVDCRRELETLSALKTRIAERLKIDDQAPGDLEARLQRALDEEDHREAVRAASAGPHTTPRRWRWAGWAAALAAVLVVAIVWSTRQPQASAPTEIADDLRRFSAGALRLDVRTSDAADLERRLSAGGLGFPTRVFDFGMMAYQLDGGGLHRLGGQRSALFAYVGQDALRVLCQMYAGRVNALPAPAERRTNDGIEFSIYREGEITVVFWQEGDVVCALAANGDTEAAIRLAFAKAVRS